MRNYFLGLCLLFALCFTACSHSDDSVDVLIIGGGASGVTAGIQSARMGGCNIDSRRKLNGWGGNAYICRRKCC